MPISDLHTKFRTPPFAKRGACLPLRPPPRRGRRSRRLEIGLQGIGFPRSAMLPSCTSLRGSAHTAVAIRPLSSPLEDADCRTSDIGHWFAMTGEEGGRAQHGTIVQGMCPRWPEIGLHGIGSPGRIKLQFLVEKQHKNLLYTQGWYMVLFYHGTRPSSTRRGTGVWNFSNSAS